MKRTSNFLLLMLSLVLAPAIHAQVNPQQDEIFWSVSPGGGVVWDLTQESRLPHSDNMEMSGQQVSAIIRYAVDEDRSLEVIRHIIFPQLRVYIDSDASRWQKYRAYLKHDFGDELLPSIACGERTFVPGPLDSVSIRGMLVFHHAPRQGIRVCRTLLPSMTERLFAERWELTNTGDSLVNLKIGDTFFLREQSGDLGTYQVEVSSSGGTSVTLSPGEQYSFSTYFAAYLNNEPAITSNFDEVLALRQDFLDTMRTHLVLRTPDTALNTLFYFSKIRAAESIFRTSMGLVHSPGGGRYYTGVWANDQAEYSGPFFPYLGYAAGNSAALNAYRVFLDNIPEGDGHFWSSFEMDGTLTCCGADRGDAAMIAFGASHYAMASGDEAVARELWPLIEWCLGYCDRRRNAAGVVDSDSDEMEGRISTGSANLSTSSLYYGALLLASDLGRSLGVPASQQNKYRQQAEAMAAAIEQHFGATIEGLDTYRYFEGHEYLRHWICLPLVMGITDRQAGTLDALFSRLWTDNGVRVEYNPNLVEPDLFWDRGTLYAFRGAFRAGGTERALEKLQAYSTTRLLGFHVPYVVEAWPEGNMAHLSAESALYCRIFTEGMLGINPTGMREFELVPRLPEAWDTLSLEHMHAFGGDVSILVQRIEKKGLSLTVMDGEKVVTKARVGPGEKVRVSLD